MYNLCKNVKASLSDVYHTSFYSYNQKKKKTILDKPVDQLAFQVNLQIDIFLGSVT